MISRRWLWKPASFQLFSIFDLILLLRTAALSAAYRSMISDAFPLSSLVSAAGVFSDSFRQMEAPGYADKVPEAVREGNSKKKSEYEAQKESVLKAMQQFEGLKI